MNDFNAVKSKYMKNSMLADGWDEVLKGRQNWMRELSDLEQRIYGEALEERVDKVVLNMLKKGFSFVSIATACDYSESRVRELQDRFVC